MSPFLINAVYCIGIIDLEKENLAKLVGLDQILLIN